METTPPSSLASACLKALACILVKAALHGELIMQVSEVVLFLVFFEKGFLCVDQAGLKLRNPPASASLVLGLKVCITTPADSHFF